MLTFVEGSVLPYCQCEFRQ